MFQGGIQAGSSENSSTGWRSTDHRFGTHAITASCHADGRTFCALLSCATLSCHCSKHTKDGYGSPLYRCKFLIHRVVCLILSHCLGFLCKSFCFSLIRDDRQFQRLEKKFPQKVPTIDDPAQQRCLTAVPQSQCLCNLITWDSSVLKCYRS